jgi:hypothetical protein
MFSRITLAWLSAVALAAGAGCRDTSTGTNDMGLRDLGVPAGSDLAGVDMSIMKTYRDTTIHEIDTAPTNDPNVGDKQNVKLTRVVAITPVTIFLDYPFCKTEVWVQDPACTTPPCGILLVAKGPRNSSATMDASAQRDCPDPNVADTILKNVNQGDTFDVTGTVGAYKPKNVTIHRIDIDSLTPNSNAGTITPIAITDSDPSKFLSNTGTNWNMYEGTLITLKPATGKFTIGAGPNVPTFVTNPGGALWARTFLFDTRVDGGVGYFPLTGDQYSQITGVVATLFNGEIIPRATSDFIP